jgi:protein MPE1
VYRASWEKHRAVTANLTSSDIQNAPPTDPDLTCPLCNRLLRDAVKTPCCSTTYCEECIHNYLSENDFVCPECESKIKSLKNLVKDEDRRERSKKYLEDMLKASKEVGDAEQKEAANDDNPGNGDIEGTSTKQSEKMKTKKEESPEVRKTPVIRTEDLGPAEEGELAGDEAVSQAMDNMPSDFVADPHYRQLITKARSQSPKSTRATSKAPSENGSATAQAGNRSQTNIAVSNNNTGMQGNNNGNMGMMGPSSNNGMASNMMSQGQMTNMFNQFNNNFGNRMPPQMQMLQGQMQGTMQMLQNPNLAPQMRMQLSMQLQQLQYTFSQMMSMMNNGYGNPMQMQMAMYAQAQQQQYMMMQNGMNNGNQMMMGAGFGYPNQGNAVPFQKTGQMNISRNASQFDENSADSPYMRVPTNPKFKASGKRERPEEFYEINNQAYKR